jgi:hypothetical protein
MCQPPRASSHNPAVLPRKNCQARHAGCLLWVTSNQFAMVALTSAFPESDRITVNRKSALWAKTYQSASQQNLCYSIGSIEATLMYLLL